MTTTWTALANGSGTGWTSIANPQKTSVISMAGEPIGLLMALTYASDVVVPFSPFTKVVNASSTPWTAVLNGT